ncbi:MAG: TonB-dependent receptor plug domain-containing protein [Flavobacteriales bacterium]|nr:TonB-dependent receptor plug domain-containing protein [Flavobacteriales bacterium]
MNKINTNIPIGLLLLVSNIYFLISTHAQDTSAFQLKEFVISETRFDKYPGIRYIQIDSVISAIYSSLPITAAIELQTGAYVRSYSNASTSSVSFRGTGGDKTNVLWNGFHINSGSLGMFDLSLMPLSHTNNLQIAYGSVSSVFGNASMGATVMMDQKGDYNSIWKITTKQNVGSYGYLANSATVQASSSKFSSFSAFNWQQAKNDFLYQDKSLPGFPWFPMPQAQYHQIMASQNLFYKPNQHNEIGFYFNYNHQYRQIPPSIGMALNQASQFDKNLRIALSGKHISGRFSHLFTQWGVGYFMDILNYVDQNVQDSTCIHQAQAYVIQKWGGWKKIKLEWGAHYQLFLPIIKQYQDAITEHRISLMAQTTWDALRWLSLFYSIRQQFTPGYSPPITGSFGTNWKILNRNKHQVSFRTLFNNGYRLPTLNDRYWSPGGNPDLLPEFSWNIEGGANYTCNKRNISISLDVNSYCMWVNNWISWLPQPEGYWSPVNIKFVRLAGFESSFLISGNHNQQLHWKISAQYTFTSAQELNNISLNKQLIYVPLHTANTSVILNYRSFFIFMASKLCSERYIRNDNSLALPPYFLGDITLGRNFEMQVLNLSAQFLIRNFTNTQYQSIENRPMPGIHFIGSIILEFNKFHFNYLRTKHQKLKP